jgi:hypothetical protein
MTNDLTLTNQNQALAKAAREEGGDGLGGTLLKFAKGRYSKGADEVELGREYIAHVDQWARGWVRFEDGKPVEKRIGRAIDDFQMPERDELGDTDEAQWETDAAGKPRDPWARQSYLPMEDVKTGEIVVFVTSSVGGRGAVGTVCDRAAMNARFGKPRIRLAVRSYRHAQFGRIETPEFTIVGWTDQIAAPPKPLRKELDDEIPF